MCTKIIVRDISQKAAKYRHDIQLLIFYSMCPKEEYTELTVVIVKS